MNSLPNYTRTAIWHVFNNLNPDSDGVVEKRHLNRLCGYVAASAQLFHQEKQLEDFQPEKKAITFDELIYFIESRPLKKASGKINMQMIDQFCWRNYFYPKYLKVRAKWLSLGPSEETAFRLWRMYNHLCVNDTVSPYEALCLLEKVLGGLKVSLSESKQGDLQQQRRRYNYWMLLGSLAEVFPSRMSEDKVQEAMEEVEDEILKCILKQGYMVKKGHRRHNWKERWFVLMPGILQYYTSKDKRVIKGVCLVNENSTVKRVEGKSNHSNRLMITCGETGKSFEISTSSFETIEAWVAVFRFAIDTAGEARTIFEHTLRQRQRKWEETLGQTPEECKLKAAIAKYDSVSRRFTHCRLDNRKSELKASLVDTNSGKSH